MQGKQGEKIQKTREAVHLCWVNEHQSRGKWVLKSKVPPTKSCFLERDWASLKKTGTLLFTQKHFLLLGLG